MRYIDNLSRIEIYRHLLRVLFLVTSLLSIISFHRIFYDGQVVEKWILSGISFCITILFNAIFSLAIHNEMDRQDYCIETIAITFLITGFVIITHSLFQVTGLITVSNTNGFRVLAGFDNPAGVAASLTVSLPFTLALIDKEKESVIKYVVLSGTCGVVMIILTIARSRVGILASGVVLLLYVLHTQKNVKTRKIIAFLLSQILLAVVVYMSFSKRGSNSGRALILGVCWDMFKDAPLFGHGLHGFRSQYMLYQADYLAMQEFGFPIYIIHDDYFLYPH